VLPDATGKVGTAVGVDCSAMMVSGSHVSGGAVLVKASAVVRLAEGTWAVVVATAGGAVDEDSSETSLTSDGRPLDTGRSVGVAVGSDANDVSLPMALPVSEGRTLGRVVSLALAVTGGSSVVELDGTSDCSGGNELIEVTVGGTELGDELSTGGVEVSPGTTSLSVELGVMLGSRTVGSEVMSGSEVASVLSLVVVASTRVVVGSAS
jgi:hypothetical protein